MGALCHLGRSSLTQTRATRGVAFATFCHMARWLNARCLKLVGRRSGPAFEPLTFVTGWIWLLSRADLHGDERGGANALRWWYSWYHAPQPRASRRTFRRRKRKWPEARGSFRPYLWCRGRRARTYPQAKLPSSARAVCAGCYQNHRNSKRGSGCPAVIFLNQRTRCAHPSDWPWPRAPRTTMG